MRVFDQISDNAGILLGSRLFQKLASFAILWLLVRILTPEEFGLYSFVMIWVMTVSTLTDMGTTNGAVRLWSENPARMAASLPRLLGIRLWLSAAGILLSAGAWFTLYRHLPPTLFALASVGILIQFHGVALTPFQAELDNWKPALWAGQNRLLVIAALVVALAIAAPLAVVLAIEIIVPVLLVARLLREALQRAARRGAGAEAFPAGELMAGLIPFGLWNILTMIYFRVDVFMLMRMSGESMVAKYAAGFRLVEPLLTFPGILGASLMPIVVARWTGGDREGAWRSVDRASRLIPLAMSLLALPLCAFATPVITFLFGPTYADSGPVMAILAWTLPLSAWAYSWHTLVFADKRYAYNNGLAAAALVLNVAGNLWAIPLHGAIGAAVMTVVTELAWSVGVSFLYLRARAGARRVLCAHLLLNAAAAGAWAGVAILVEGGTGRAVGAVAGLFLLVLGGRVTGLVTRDDLNGLLSYAATLKSRLLRRG